MEWRKKVGRKEWRGMKSRMRGRDTEGRDTEGRGRVIKKRGYRQISDWLNERERLLTSSLKFSHHPYYSSSSSSSSFSSFTQIAQWQSRSWCPHRWYVHLCMCACLRVCLVAARHRMNRQTRQISDNLLWYLLLHHLFFYRFISHTIYPLTPLYPTLLYSAHILVDVSHFVHPDTAMDKEAAHRSTSTYLVGTSRSLTEYQNQYSLLDRFIYHLLFLFTLLFFFLFLFLFLLRTHSFSPLLTFP